MALKNPFFKKIVPLMKDKTVFSISGVSGTGKTSLALFLMGHSLTHSKPFSYSGIWIQASEFFPKNRLKSMFESEPEKLAYISNHIYVIPRTLPFHNYTEQSETIKKIFDEQMILPPQVQFLVIDNISHHLRYEISKYHDITKITSKLNTFFEAVLLPLVLFCNREKIKLLLIHETSYDPAANQNRPFFHKLYHRIDSLFINLEIPPSEHPKYNFMHIQSDYKKVALKYRIIDHGFKTFCV